jgi:hypothetical protein
LGKDVPSVRLPTLDASVGNYEADNEFDEYTSEDSNVPDWFNSDDDDDATEDDSDPDTSDTPMDPKYRRGRRGTTAAMSTLSMKAMNTAATWTI